MVFLHALQGIFGLLLIVSLGYMLARKGWFSPETQILLPRLVTSVALPPYLFYTIIHSFGRDDLVHLLYGSLFPLLSILLTFAVALLVARIARVERRHLGLFCTSFATSNTVFIGLPVNLALFGESAAPYVLLYFFANTTFFWTIGNYAVSHDNEELRGHDSVLDNVRHVFSPPMLGFLAGAALTLLDFRLPGFLQDVARYLGNLTTPLALIFIGVCLWKMDLRHLRLSRDLVLAPAGQDGGLPPDPGRHAALCGAARTHGKGVHHPVRPALHDADLHPERLLQDRCRIRRPDGQPLDPDLRRHHPRGHDPAFALALKGRGESGSPELLRGEGGTFTRELKVPPSPLKLPPSSSKRALSDRPP